VLPMVEKATHVAVINYWGYHLNNDSIPHERYAVIPIKK